MRHGGRERPYLLYVPSSPPSGDMPLVLELHGRGVGAEMFDRWAGFSALAEKAGFVLAMPSAVGEIWNDGRYPEMTRDGPDDLGYLLAVAGPTTRSRHPAPRAVSQREGAWRPGRSSDRRKAP
jgi:polyhydroxybutyrate depolymerase